MSREGTIGGVFSQDYKNGSFKPNFEVNGENWRN